MLAKIGPFLRGEVAVLGVVDLGPDEVGRQQVGGELDALEVGPDGPGQRLTARVLGRSAAFRSGLSGRRSPFRFPRSTGPPGNPLLGPFYLVR